MCLLRVEDYCHLRFKQFVPFITERKLLTVGFTLSVSSIQWTQKRYLEVAEFLEHEWVCVDFYLAM